MSATDGRAIKSNVRIRNRSRDDVKVTFPSRMRNLGKEHARPVPYCDQPPHPAGMSTHKRRGLHRLNKRARS